jgi:hypothetical protein
MRYPVDPPPSLADQHTLVAQRYAGYFVGHPYRAAQQRVGPGAIQVDRSRPWREPAVVSDDCEFCRRLTDDEAERRVAGYQHAIDIEVLRPHALAYAEWLGSDAPVVVEEVNIAGVVKRRGVGASQANRRKFIETHGDVMDVKPLPLIDLPLRLKRKLCIEWNHLYRDWLREHPDIQYDFATRTFYRDVPAPDDEAPVQPKEWWHGYAPDSPLWTGR